jgi:uncharacterized phage-associated protein
MADVFDTAQYILHLFRKNNKLPITTWKLQKLVYYSQAWASVWDDEAIFEERIEAWANGPVCPALYDIHRGAFKIENIALGSSKKLSKKHRSTIKAVFNYYGAKDSQYLSALTHSERPWKDARRGLKLGERGNHEITIDSMAEYYGGL